MSKKSLNSRISRWALELENYNYTIAHRKGVNMGHVDALSRNLPVSSVFDADLSEYSLDVQSDDIDFYLHATQSRDPKIVQLRTQLEQGEVPNFELENGLLYRKMEPGHCTLYVPAEMQVNVIRLIHEKIGHLGTDKCYDQIRLQYWFPSMRRKIQSFIENCIPCIMHTPPSRINERNLHSIPKNPYPLTPSI